MDAIAQFKISIKKYLDNSISLSQLESNLSECIASSPDKVEELQSILLELFSRRIISKPVFDKLYLKCHAPEPVAEPSVPAVEKREPVKPLPKVTTFQEALKLYHQKEVTSSQLVELVGELITSNPEQKSILANALHPLLDKKIIDDALYNDLLKLLSREAGNSEPAQPDVHAPQETISPTSTIRSAEQPKERVVEIVKPQEPHEEKRVEELNPKEPEPERNIEVIKPEEPEFIAPEPAAEPALQIEQPTEDYSALTLKLELFSQHRLSYQSLEDSVATTVNDSHNKQNIAAILKQFADDNKLQPLVVEGLIARLNTELNTEDFKAFSEVVLGPLDGEEQLATPEETDNQDVSENSDEVLEDTSEQKLDTVTVSETDDAENAASAADYPDSNEADDDDDDKTVIAVKKPSPLVSEQDEEESEDKTVVRKPSSKSQPVAGPAQTEDENVESEAEDKTVVRGAIKSIQSQEDDDKTVVKKPTKGALADESVEDDKTVVRASGSQEPVSDDSDKTQVRRPGAEQPDSTDITSRTESTTSTTGFNTTQTSTTGTSSTWSKPFESQEEIEPLKIGSVLKGRFRLTGFIGRGGMGDVFKAEDLRRVDAGDVVTEVAVKVLNSEFKDHPDSLKSLQREARKTQDLAHPHIVNVFDFDRDESHVFMTMELMTGNPLNTELKNNKKGFEWPLVKKYVAELSAALQYAHRRGVVHADLKPGNIFISKGEVKVFDFGIARAANTGIKKGEVEDTFDAGDIGALTPGYASLEMLDGEADADPRDDIYALGCITYELLTGSHPFLVNKKKVPADEAKERGLKPPKIKFLKPWQQKALESCLAFERDKRCSSVNEFVSEFLTEKKSLTGKQIGIRAISAAVILSLAGGGFYYYQDRKIQQFAELIGSTDHEDIIARYKEINAEGKSSRAVYFEDTRVSEPFLKYLESRVKYLSKSGVDEFEQAQELADIAQDLYPYGEIKHFIDIAEQRKSQRVGELSNLLVEFTNDPSMFRDSYKEFAEYWSILARVDEKNPQLNAGVGYELQRQIELFIDGDQLEEAAEMADFSIKFFEQQSSFFDFIPDTQKLKAKVDSLLQVRRVAGEVDMLRDSISSLQTAENLQDFLPHLNEIERMNEISVTDEVLVAVLKNLKELLMVQVKVLTGNAEWANASALVDDYRAALSSIEQEQFESLIASAEQNRKDDINRVKREIAKLVELKKLDEAEALVSTLDSTGASQEDIVQAFSGIAQGWLKQARIDKNNQRWAEARNAVEKGLMLVNSGQVADQLQQEVSDIELAESEYTEVVASAERTQKIEQAERDKQQKIVALQSKLLQALDKDDLSDNAVQEMKVNVDSLEALEPTLPVVVEFESRLTNKYLTKIEQVGRSDIDSAISLAQQAYANLPLSALLQNKVNDLLEQKAQIKQEEKQQKLAELENGIKTFIGNDLTNDKMSQIAGLMRDYKQLQTNTIATTELQAKIATAFVNLARQEEKEKQFDNANLALNNAKEFAPGLQLIKDAERSIATSELSFQEIKEEKIKEQRLASLQASFLNNIRAANIEQATDTLNELESQLPANSPFLVSTVPAEYLSMYVKLADQDISARKFVEAKENIDNALEYSPDNLQLLAKQEELSVALQVIDLVDKNPVKANAILTGSLDVIKTDSIFGYLSDLLTAQNAIRKTPLRNQNETPTVDQVSKSNQELPSASNPSTSIVKETVTATATTKVDLGQPCLDSYAGRGARLRCYDYVNNEVKGPNLIVVPPLNGVSFAIGKYEVRVEDYNIYCRTSGQCSGVNNDQNLPVTGLSIEQMKGYINWLSEVTSKQYRLPTLSEWEHAANADGGRQASDKNCVIYDSYGNAKHPDRLQNVNFLRKASENSWGLSNYLGNADEVVVSRGSYLTKGGNYKTMAADCEINYSLSVIGKVDNTTGFRVVRNIDPDE